MKLDLANSDSGEMFGTHAKYVINVVIASYTLKIEYTFFTNPSLTFASEKPAPLSNLSSSRRLLSSSF